MAQIVNIASNLPSASSPWGRQVTDGLNTIATDVERFKANQTNLNRANNTNIQTLVTQQATLTSQQAALTSQQNYLASLITKAVNGNDYLTGNIPGDQTLRWNNGDNSTLLQFDKVPTGKLFIMFGAGSIEARSGNSTMYAQLRVEVSAPNSGYVQTLGSATRLFVTGGVTIGVPAASARIFEGIPTNEPINVRVQFGTWSAGTSPQGTASFLTPFLSAEIIPA